MLLGLGTLEPPAQSDAGPRVMQAGVVILHGMTIGMLGAAVIVAHGRPYAVITVAAIVAALPLLIWFVRARSRWLTIPALRTRYAVLLGLTAAVAAGWGLRAIAG
jgi:hypothetical protein